MNRVFLSRIWLDALTAGLLLFGLAYWWLGNLAHEIAGAVMFLLLVAHNLFNRRWWGGVARTKREPRSLVNLGVTLALLGAVSVLLVTSLLISHALSPILPPWDGFTVRQLHTLAAYWVLVIVAIHLGLRWPMLMGVARNLSGLQAPNPLRTTVLRAIAVAIALHGAWSSAVLGLGGKLSMQMTLDWWNFEETVAGFFIHCATAAGLVMVLTYYGLKLLQFGTRESGRAPRFQSRGQPR